MKSTTYVLLMMMVLAMLQCTETNPGTETAVPFHTPQPAMPMMDTLRTRDELLAVVILRRQQMENERVAQEARDDAARIERLVDHCAKRANAIRNITLHIQQCLVQKSDVQDHCDVNDVSLGNGFCAMASLAEHGFYASYNAQYQFVRSKLQSWGSNSNLYLSWFGGDNFWYGYRFHNKSVDQKAIRAFFDLYDKQRAQCGWRPCEI